MYRTAVLTTLMILLLAIAGVTVAQESTVTAPGLANDTSAPDETTIEETTGIETTQESTSPETREKTIPGIGSSRSSRQVSAKKSDDKIEKAAKLRPESATHQEGRDRVNAVGKQRPDNAGKSLKAGKRAKLEEGRGAKKVSVCHKGKTLAIGAPAKRAHLRHGDVAGICR